MPKSFECPYWRSENKGVCRCEAGRITFDENIKLLNEYEVEYCASVENWRNCTMAQVLNRHYESEEQ